MTEGFNLSDKIQEGLHPGFDSDYLFSKDVKEFIRLLKKEVETTITHGKQIHTKHKFMETIDKLAGEKLIHVHKFEGDACSCGYNALRHSDMYGGI